MSRKTVEKLNQSKIAFYLLSLMTAGVGASVLLDDRSDESLQEVLT